MSKNNILLKVLICTCIITSFCSASEKSNEPNVVELVNDVRASEMWIHDFNSLYILAEPKWTNTSDAIAKRRLEIIKEYNVPEPNVLQFSDLRAEHKETLEYAVDRKRVRYMTDDRGYWRQIKIWDGNELNINEKYYHKSREYYVIHSKIEERMFNEIFSCYFGWPRSQAHSFWWDKKNVDELMNYYGIPEKFRYIGKQKFREIPCYVLEYDAEVNLTFRWFVAQSNHLLHGIQTRRGNFVSTEHWALDYKEVVPGGWFPMKTGWSFYDKGVLGLSYLRSTCNIDVKEFRINEPLSEELFHIDFKDGVQVQDWRSGEMVSYVYKVPLIGTSVSPIIEGINIDIEQIQGNTTLFCFFDIEQRPSRHCINELNKKAQKLKEKNIQVILIHASKIERDVLDEWVKENNVPFKVEMIDGNNEETLYQWSIRALPWLILTDKENIVQAEGFSIIELDSKLNELENNREK